MTADQSNPGVLALYPLRFAGATPDVIVAPSPPPQVPVVGLPQASFKEVVKRDGSREGAIQAVVDPPQGGGIREHCVVYAGAWRFAAAIDRAPACCLG
jgi:hypothetical protein